MQTSLRLIKVRHLKASRRAKVELLVFVKNHNILPVTKEGSKYETVETVTGEMCARRFVGMIIKKSLWRSSELALELLPSSRKSSLFAKQLIKRHYLWSLTLELLKKYLSFLLPPCKGDTVPTARKWPTLWAANTTTMPPSLTFVMLFFGHSSLAKFTADHCVCTNTQTASCRTNSRWQHHLHINCLRWGGLYCNRHNLIESMHEFNGKLRFFWEEQNDSVVKKQRRTAFDRILASLQ